MGNINTLMAELADAVRLKSGETGEMSIRQMITAMAGITVSGDIGFTSGTFAAPSTGRAQVITHGLGHKPGAILFVKKHSFDSSSKIATSMATVNDSLVSIIFGEDSGMAYGYNTLRRSSSSSNYTLITSRSWSYSQTVPVEVFGTGSAASLYITNINETAFTSPKGLIDGRTYFWIAFRAPLV